MKTWVRNVYKTIFPQSPREWSMTLPLAAFIVVAGVSLVLDRRPVVSSSAQLLTPQVKAGEDFVISYAIEWSTNCRIDGRRFLVDSTRKSIPFAPDTRLVRKGLDQFEIRLTVPKDAALGPAQYRGVIAYKCNWLQSLLPIEQTLSTRDFEIIE